MNIFIGYDANLPTQLWIAARYLEAVTFLIAPFFIARRVNAGITFWGFLLVTATLITLIFSGYFPACYIEGSGLTAFKIVSEYVICLILLGAMALLSQKKAYFSRDVLLLLYGALIATIFSELAFTSYVSVYGPANYLGHIFKIVAFALIYQAIVVTGLQRPFEILFRNLSKSEKKYRALFENMDEGVAVCELIRHENDITDYRFIDVNFRYAAMMGLTPEDIIGKTGTDMYGNAASPPHLKYYRTVAASGKTVRFNALYRPEMKYYTVSVFMVDPDQLATVVSDITALKISEDALIRANKKLQLLTQVTRHDINNDLSLAYASIDLLKGAIPDTPETNEIVGYLRESIDAINAKIGFTRSYEQMGSQKPSWQSVSSIVRNIRKEDPRFSSLKVEDSLGSLEIFADLMLPKVFANLMDNSIRHGKTVSTIYLYYQQIGNGCRIIYEDDGAGVSVEAKARIFEPSYSKIHGFGLFLIREILLLTGIEITEEGEKGKGAKFVLHVPQGGYRIM
ncbi:multi-sensor signal transduction histidine kinase [Methanospirillum hungatei JF-1]|uniref:histidine kinase n=2 Tax=Methanospirillum hungatei TaxID=2203 RepID=Q2FST3_METHJ|nr:multi-sensor signal transduction histidine kinase [Methanospirillum hungatei JF-1]